MVLNMGGNSTLQGAPLGRGNDRKIGDFDLRSWQGLTEVLRVAKESIKDPYAYAEFRNAVLEYAQKGGDESLRKGIETTLRSITGETIQKVVAPSSVSKEPRSAVIEEKRVERTTPPPVAVAQRRPVPSFAPPTPTPPNEQEPQTSKSAPAAPEIVLDVPRPKPVAPANLPVEQAGSAPVVKSVPSPTPAPEKQPEEASAPAPYKSIDMHKARIAEIKRSVHDRIGNPATLIDTHNETGKQYMQALLTALKATSAGSPVGIETAMKNLEMVFTKLLSEGDAPAPKPKAPAPQPPVPKQTPSAPVAPKVATFAPPAPKPAASRQVPIAVQKQTMPPFASTPTPVQKPVPAPQRASAEVQRPAPTPIPTASPVPSEVSKVVPKPTPAQAPTLPPVTPVVRPRVETQAPPQKQAPTPAAPKAPAQPAPVAPRPRVPETAQTPSTPTSVSPVVAVAVKESAPTPKPVAPAAPPPARIAPLPRPSVSEDSVRQSELSKPEVTQALENLLNEWPIFKSSGMLGMGPHGVRHPLYVKLAGLSMGEVLAGRFERTDMKAVKIIKEYVLAWRHEQGIAYTINETFEHYLRRVVERILRRQKE